MQESSQWASSFLDVPVTTKGKFMPAIVWIAIAIAIVMMGIGAGASFPDLPQYVFRPMVEKGVEVFKPVVWALALALGVVAGLFVYRKWFKREAK